MDPVTLYNPVDRQPVVVTVPAEENRLRAAGYRDEKPFDPRENTVEEVQKYLAEHPDDTRRVLALEQAGRQRVGIIGKPDEAEDGAEAAGPDSELAPDVVLPDVPAESLGEPASS